MFIKFTICAILGCMWFGSIVGCFMIPYDLNKDNYMWKYDNTNYWLRIIIRPIGLIFSTVALNYTITWLTL